MQNIKPTAHFINAHDWHTHTTSITVWTRHININQKQWQSADSTFYTDARHMDADISMGLQTVLKLVHYTQQMHVQHFHNLAFPAEVQMWGSNWHNTNNTNSTSITLSGPQRNVFLSHRNITLITTITSWKKWLNTKLLWATKSKKNC